MKKIMCAIVALIMTVMPFMSRVNAEEMPDLSHSDCVYLYNQSDDVIIYEKNSTKRISPGPAVKLMTAAVAIDCLGDDLGRIVTINKNNIQRVYGNNINLQNGEELTDAEKKWVAKMEKKHPDMVPQMPDPEAPACRYATPPETLRSVTLLAA